MYPFPQLTVSVDCFRDLGIIFSNNLSWNEHYKPIQLGPIYDQLNLIRLIYIFLRSRVTYCSQLWRPHLIKDIQVLERIQRRATKCILNYFISDYRWRPISIHLLSLNVLLRFVRYFIFHQMPPVSWSQFSYTKVCLVFTAYHSLWLIYTKLAHQLHTSTQSRHFFFKWIVRLWNTLPTVDLSLSFSTIKRHLYTHSLFSFSSQFRPKHSLLLSYHLPVLHLLQTTC